MTSFLNEQTPAMASPAELRALIESRRAVRRFTPEPVPDAVIRDCLELAVLAPNSCNLQPWSFQVIRDPALLAQLHPVCMSQNASRAPLIIVVLARPDTWRQACRSVIDYWPEAEVPARIRSFYSKTAPFQYNQGPLGLLGLFKRQLVRLMGVRKPLMRKPNSKADMRLWAVKSTALATENLMLAFQSHGYASCPMEGFDEPRLRRVLDIPRQAVPIMLLAVGRQGEKGVYNPRLRFPLEQHVTWR
ncbi:nitroreductase family protein [Ectopseudomonas toyotomiensis]|uniref:Nitroreductase family protein n=1 Tax=Ectopseudomonas toyotomiensis TaxID=554344 RepID=A0AA42INT9_9GAMM|nr:nitroreductase family protein [Pseudomonas toyotomiensis]MBG0841408.1 nitroreductase family protein [Pseudomonas toyotomiensis]MDH0700461.1 nitroreductase family protein [Pseudomonas toyotomiensis]